MGRLVVDEVSVGCGDGVDVGVAVAGEGGVGDGTVLAYKASL